MNDKFTIARTLDEISRYIELSDPQPFRARAFEKAARAVENLDEDIETLVDAGTLTSIEGVGKATAQVIEEIVRTGQSRYLTELRDQYPPGIFELLRVPKLGLKKIAVVYKEARRRLAGRAGSRGERRAAVPLMPMTSMMTTNRAAPGGARQRRAAHVRPRCTCRPKIRLGCVARTHTIRSAARASSRCSSARKRA